MIEKLSRVSPKLLSRWKVYSFIRITQAHALWDSKSMHAGLRFSIPYRFYSSSHKHYSEEELVELNEKATEAFKEGDYEEAIDLWELIVRSENYSKDGPAVVSCLNNLASAYGKAGQNARKIEILEKVRQVVRRVYGAEHPQYAMALYHLACSKEEVGMYENMRCHLEESLVVHEKRFSPMNIKVARVLLLLANAHEKLGEPAAQLERARRAFEITKHHYGAEHIQTTTALMILGPAYGANQQPEQYLRLARRAFEIQERRLGPGNFQLAFSLLELAKAHAANGDYAKQRELLERSLRVQERALGEQPTHLVETYLCLGNAYAHLGEVESMAHHYNEALKIARRGDDSNPVDIGRAAIKAALGNLQVGNLTKARRLAVEAAELLSTVSHSHPLAKELAEIEKKLAANDESGKNS